jgi:hypothetical protein
MKNILFVILGFFIYLMSGCNQSDEYQIIDPGVGLENIKVNESTLVDLISKYGKSYSLDSFYVNQDPLPDSIELVPGYNKILFSYCYSYDSLGVAFYFKPEKETLYSISCKFPFKGKTINNLFLDSSTFRDVEKIYGIAEWEFTRTTIRKDYNGIIFSRNFNGQFPVPDSVLNTYLDKKVTGIYILQSRQ